jgi:small subunit ribosomal protein S5
MRAVFEALGLRDVVAKSIGSSNPHNMIRATFEGLTRILSPRSVASKRGKKVSDIIGRRETTETNGAAAEVSNGASNGAAAEASNGAGE